MESDLKDKIESLERKKKKMEISEYSYRIKLTDCIINLIQKKLNYEYVSKLGHGSWSEVFLMKKAGTDENFAMKVVPSERTQMKEAEVWPSLKHRNILRLLETIFAPASQVYVFVMPAQKTALDIILMSETFAVDPEGLEKIKSWFYDLLSGLEYLHQRRLCHCDLKANNVFIAHNLDAIIGDFTYLNTTTELVNRYGLPLVYRPPEVIGRSRGSKIAAEGVPFDLWSMGILALNVVTGHFFKGKVTGYPPLWSENVYPVIYDLMKIKKLTERIRRVLPSVKVSSKSATQIQNFIALFLRLELYSRVSASVAKTHNFLGRNQFEKEPEIIWIRKETAEYIDRLISWYSKPDYSYERLQVTVGEQLQQEDTGEEPKLTLLIESEADDEFPDLSEDFTDPGSRLEVHYHGPNEASPSVANRAITVKTQELLGEINKEMEMAANAENEKKATVENSVREKKIERSIKLLESKLNYRLSEKLGSGNFNEVIPMLVPDGGGEVTIKVVTGVEVASFEHQQWPGLYHPNLHRLSKIICFPSMNTHAYVFPWHDTSLKAMLRNERFLEDPECLTRLKKWLFDILCGVQYLHARRLCHLDLKSDNILITADLKAVISNFSFLCSASQPTLRCGLSLYFRPPEACLSRGLDIPLDGLGIDLWSMGVLALNIFTGHSLRSKLIRQPSTWSEFVYPVLFKTLQIKRLCKSLSLALPSSGVSKKSLNSIRNFVTMFLRLDPIKRPPLDIAVRHELLGDDLFSNLPEKIWVKKASIEEIESLVSSYGDRKTRRSYLEDTDPTSSRKETKDSSKKRLNKVYHPRSQWSSYSQDPCEQCKVELIERVPYRNNGDSAEDSDSTDLVERITILDNDDEGSESTFPKDITEAASSRVTNGESTLPEQDVAAEEITEKKKHRCPWNDSFDMKRDVYSSGETRCRKQLRSRKFVK